MNATANYVSVLFPTLLQPIVDLFNLMMQKEPKGPNEVQASQYENGCSVSIVVLAALTIESICNRVRYILKDDDRKKVVQTLRDLQAGELAADVEEVFVVRDVIAHNHLWEAIIKEDDEKGLDLISATLRSGYGDEKFDRVVDRSKRQTRRLHLDVFPNRIHHKTAIVAIQKCAEVLRFLENKDNKFIPIEPNIALGRDIVGFYKWATGLS